MLACREVAAAGQYGVGLFFRYGEQRRTPNVAQVALQGVAASRVIGISRICGARCRIVVVVIAQRCGPMAATAASPRADPEWETARWTMA